MKRIKTIMKISLDRNNIHHHYLLTNSGILTHLEQDIQQPVPLLNQYTCISCLFITWSNILHHITAISKPSRVTFTSSHSKSLKVHTWATAFQYSTCKPNQDNQIQAKAFNKFTTINQSMSESCMSNIWLTSRRKFAYQKELLITTFD